MSDFKIDFLNFKKEELISMKEAADNLEEANNNGDDITGINDVDTNTLFNGNDEISIDDLVLAFGNQNDLSLIPSDKLEQYKLYAQLINNGSDNISEDDVKNISKLDGDSSKISSEDIKLMLDSLEGVENIGNTIESAIEEITLLTTGINVSTSGAKYNPETGEYTIVVEPYQTSKVEDGHGGKRYSNGTLWGITENVYGSDVKKSLLYKYIQELNPQIKDIDLIYTDDELKLPILEYDEKGNITGYKKTDIEHTEPISEEIGEDKDLVEIEDKDPVEEEDKNLVEIKDKDPIEEEDKDLVEIKDKDPIKEEDKDPVVKKEDAQTNDGVLLGGNLDFYKEYSSSFFQKTKLWAKGTASSLNKADNANGEIDRPAYQGRTGDCALIAGVYAFASTEKGSDIIKDAITINKGKDGTVESYTVNFKGINESYTITAKELNKETNFDLGRIVTNSKFSAGDKDMALLELAIKKCANETTKVDFDKQEKKLNGIYFTNINYLFTGEHSNYTNPTGFLNKLDNNELSKDTVGLIGFEKNQKVKEIDGDKIKLIKNHAYTITEVTKDSVTLLNPWNTGESIILSRDTFENLETAEITYYDLSKIEE